MLKYTTFDTSKIRRYIESDPAVLEKGIRYMKTISPGESDFVAREAVIRQAQQICQRKWENDSTGYIDSEYKAYTEFANDVARGRYFSAAPSYSNTSSASGRDWFLFIICLLFGYLGIHRFLDDKKFTGLIWLCTGGCFVIGWIVDCIRIWKGDF